MSPIRMSVAALALMCSAHALHAQAAPRATRAMMQDTTMMPCPAPALRDSAKVRSGGAMGGGAMGGGAMARPAADSTKRPCTPPAGTMDRDGMKKPAPMQDATKKPDPMARPPRD